MAKEDNNQEFDMGMFDNLEVNLDFNPENIVKEEETPPTPQNEDINPNEEEDITPPEEVVEEEETDEGDDTPDNTEDETSPNLYSSFAAVLQEKGLLPSLDLQENTNIESIDDLSNAFKTEIDSQVNNYLVSKIGEDGVKSLEKGVTLAEYQQYQDNNATLDSITEESLADNVELSKNIIYQDYIRQGLSETRAASLLSKSVDAGDEALIEDAKESLASLKVLEGRRLEQLEEQRVAEQKAIAKQQEKIDNDLKNAIYNSDEIITGIKLNKTIQDKIYNSITKIVGQDPNGVMENKLMRDRRENPVEFDTKLYYLYEITNGFTDFSSMVNKANSKAISTLEQQLRKTKFESDGTPSYFTDPDSYGGIGGELVI